MVSHSLQMVFSGGQYHHSRILHRYGICDLTREQWVVPHLASPIPRSLTRGPSSERGSW